MRVYQQLTAADLDAIRDERVRALEVEHYALRLALTVAAAQATSAATVEQLTASLTAVEAALTALDDIEED